MLSETNYSSGEDYEIEFLGYRFAFNAFDFEQRVTAAAVKLGLVATNELDEDETGDLVELVHRGLIDEPRSGLGRYVVRHWERLSLVDGESLVYWLRKLVSRCGHGRIVHVPSCTSSTVRGASDGQRRVRPSRARYLVKSLGRNCARNVAARDPRG